MSKIKNMKLKEIDDLIAIKVTKLKKAPIEVQIPGMKYVSLDSDIISPRYSQDPNAATSVLTMFEKFSLEKVGDLYKVMVGKDQVEYVASAETFPLAVCQAALMSIGFDLDDETE